MAVKKEANIDIHENLGTELMKKDFKKEFLTSEVKPRHPSHQPKFDAVIETQIIGGEEIKFFKCPTCESRFEKRSHLNRHYSSVHEDIRPHPCTECDMKFKQKYHLKRHFARAHGGEFDPDFNPKEELEEAKNFSFDDDISYDPNKDYKEYKSEDYEYENQDYADYNNYLETNMEENDYEYIDYAEEKIE